LEHKPIEVYGDGSQVMDMVFVADVAMALVRTLEAMWVRDDSLESVVEVGTGRRTTVLEVAQAVWRLVGCSPRIRYLPMRPGEQTGRDVVADASTLRQIGMDPAGLTALDDGLKPTVEWYRRVVARGRR
jgi:nucleoside-diphosphate-sugar epimerase